MTISEIANWGYLKKYTPLCEVSSWTEASKKSTKFILWVVNAQKKGAS